MRCLQVAVHEYAALTRKIVDSHDGVISVSPAPGGGCSFTITLPNDAHAQTAILAADGPEKSEAQRILLVDDEEDVIMTMKEILENDGHMTISANSGLEALKHLENNDIDLIITDLRMQDMDGPGLYREIEKHFPDKISRIGFVTGDALGKSIKSFLDETDRPTVEKPFSPNDIRSLVKGLSTP